MQPLHHVVRLDFRGSALQLFGWALLLLLASILIVPGAWVYAAMCRWSCKNIRFSDEIIATFSGTGRQIVGWWILSLLLTGGLPLHPVSAYPIGGSASSVVCFFLGTAVGLKLIRWFVAHVELSSGVRLSFTGSYLELLGWSALNAILLLTIVRWAGPRLPYTAGWRATRAATAWRSNSRARDSTFSGGPWSRCC